MTTKKYIKLNYGRLPIPAYFAFICLFLSIGLSVAAKFNQFFPIDVTVTRAIQEYHPLWFDNLMKLLTEMGFFVPGVMTVLIITVAVFLLRKRNDAVFLFLSAAGSPVVASIIKEIIRRPRPDPRLIHQYIPYTQQDSYPSGHVMFYIGLYGFLIYLIYTEMKPGILRTVLMIFLSLLLILIGLSRIYLGAHWLSDVAASYLFGYIWLFIIISLYNR